MVRNMVLVHSASQCGCLHGPTPHYHRMKWEGFATCRLICANTLPLLLLLLLPCVVNHKMALICGTLTACVCNTHVHTCDVHKQDPAATPACQAAALERLPNPTSTKVHRRGPNPDAPCYAQKQPHSVSQSLNVNWKC